MLPTWSHGRLLNFPSPITYTATMGRNPEPIEWLLHIGQLRKYNVKMDMKAWDTFSTINSSPNSAPYVAEPSLSLLPDTHQRQSTDTRLWWREVWQLFVGDQAGERVLGDLLSLWAFFWLVGSEVTGWSFRNLNLLAPAVWDLHANGQNVVILHSYGLSHKTKTMNGLSFCWTTERYGPDCCLCPFRRN